MWNKFKNNTDGNVAMMFGIGSMAFVVAAGAAIDYSGLSSRATTLQDMSDIATLAAAASQETNPNKLQAIVDESIRLHNVNGWTINATVKVVDETIRVIASTPYDTVLMGAVGKDKLPVKVQSEAPFGTDTPLNIALVLDRTDSMNEGGKIDEMKTAANKLVKKLDKLKNQNIRMSVVPFSNYVNVGMSNRNASWMDVPSDSSTTGAEICYMKKDVISKSGCNNQSYTYYDDGIEKTGTKEVCSNYTYGPEYEHCYTPTSTTTWNGCAGSRDNPDHKTPAYGTKRIPGVMNVSCGVEMLPLTTDLKAAENKITSITGDNDTYIPSGLVWGWRSLDRNLPFNEASAVPAEDTLSVMVLMSDGANAMKLNAPLHEEMNPPDQDELDDTNDLTDELCTGIKDDDVLIFTVAYQFASNAAATKKILSDCASSPENFFDAQNAKDLNDAFERIGNELFSVRLSR